MSQLGQNRKHSIRANVFRYSPNSRHSSGHAEAVPLNPANSRMAHGRRDRQRRSRSQRHQHAVGTGNELFHDRGMHNSLALADRLDVVTSLRSPFSLVPVAAEFVTVFVFDADFHPTPRPILIVVTSAVAIAVRTAISSV